MVATAFLGEVKGPVGVEVATGAERAQAKDRLGAGERPASPRPSHAVAVTVVGGSCGRSATKPDCDAWIAKIRACPLEGMSPDPAAREENLAWRLGKCRDALTGTGPFDEQEREQARCALRPTCDEFRACVREARESTADRQARESLFGL